VSVSHPDFGQAFPCRCQGADDPAARAAALRRYSNLGALARITLEDTNPQGLLDDATSQQLFSQALAAAREFAENPTGWLVLTGPSGSGKTHLAAAIANRCIQRGQTAFFIVAADLLDHLRAAYAPDSEVTYDELFDQVRQAPVLVLDDLTSLSATPWAQEKLFQVFNHRFNAALPTVVTVRGPLHRLEEGLRARLEGSMSASGRCRVLSLGIPQSRLARRLGEVPAEMRQGMTFDSFDPRGRSATRKDQQTLSQAKKAAQTFAAQPKDWLLFTGPHGCGKTHLAVAVASEVSDGGQMVFFAFVPALLDHLRATFRPDNPMGYDELFEQLKTVSLLVLDDLGAESSTPWAEEKLYQIVVHRYVARLPTIITTALMDKDLEETKPRLFSRLVDTHVVTWVPISAPNYRDQRRPSQSAGGEASRSPRAKPGAT
jgi:DNA replication protein DnaC